MVDVIAAPAASTVSINPSQPPGRTLLPSAAFNGEYVVPPPHTSLIYETSATFPRVYRTSLQKEAVCSD